MIQRVGWSIWAILPVLGMAFHFGPGQEGVRRDEAARTLAIALEAETHAQEAQRVAHDAQLATIEARRRFFVSGAADDEAEATRLLEVEKQAYGVASDAWKEAADRFAAVEEHVDDEAAAIEIRWAKARSLVRAGEIWNGIDELQSLLDGELGQDTATAVREELAAAHYYGARILREEGRPATLWREVSGVARQHYRFLAERALDEGRQSLADDLQRNLERVLDLEQLGQTELVAKPLPRESPRGRRPGDREPGNRPGRGPLRDGPPGNGAGGLLEIGPGW